MINFKMPKEYILRFLSFCLLYFLYILVGEIWFTALFAHDNWINLSGIIIIAVLLVLLYTFINTRLSLGTMIYIFYIPILPSFIGALLFHPIEYNLFPNLYTHDDLGAGILMFMIAFPHWGAMILSFLLADKLKMRLKKGWKSFVLTCEKAKRKVLLR